MDEDESLLMIAERHGPDAVSETTAPQHPAEPRPVPEATREAMARAAITSYMDSLRPSWLRRWLKT